MRLNKKRILVACHDPGSGEIISTVSKKLLSYNYDVIPIVSGPSSIIFKRNHIKALIVRQDINKYLLEKKIKNFNPSLIITGAGTYNFLEHNVRIISKKLNIKQIAIVDYWCEYGNRFKRKENNKQ